MALISLNNLERFFNNLKTYISNALSSKANTSHTHTKSEITDFPTLSTVATSGSYNDLSNKPTIPSKTSDLTNDSGYITSSGSCNYANSAGYVQGNNNSANAANALLRSGRGRTDSSPEGDTWIFFDECGAPDAPWGFKHNQGANTIGFYGSGAETSSINLSNGHFSGSCNYANSAGSAGSVAWSNVSGRPTALSQFTNDSGFLTSADLLPIGSYIQFAGSQAPAGFLVCNGGAISRTTYSALFAVIGTTYGSGDGSTTFNLPDLTDRFLQGSTTVGTYKSAGLPNITGVSSGNQDQTEALSGAFYFINRYLKNSGDQPYASQEGFNASRCSTIYGNSTTVQPPALTCLICIKY